jgi:hypothetical protein
MTRFTKLSESELEVLRCALEELSWGGADREARWLLNEVREEQKEREKANANMHSQPE